MSGGFFHRRGQDDFRESHHTSELFAQDPVLFFSSKAYFHGVEGNPETCFVFFFNPGNFCGGGFVAIGEKNQLDQWPLKGVGWGLAVCEIIPGCFRGQFILGGCVTSGTISVGMKYSVSS